METVEKGLKLPQIWFMVSVHNNKMIEEVYNCISTTSYFICQQSTMASSFSEKKSHNSWIWGWKQSFFYSIGHCLDGIFCFALSSLDVSWQLLEKQLERHVLSRNTVRPVGTFNISTSETLRAYWWVVHQLAIKSPQTMICTLYYHLQLCCGSNCNAYTFSDGLLSAAAPVQFSEP